MDKAKKAKLLSCVRAVIVLLIAFACILFLVDIPVSMFLLNEKPMSSSGLLKQIDALTQVPKKLTL